MCWGSRVLPNSPGGHTLRTRHRVLPAMKLGFPCLGKKDSGDNDVLLPSYFPDLFQAKVAGNDLILSYGRSGP